MYANLTALKFTELRLTSCTHVSLTA
uniref:Uncharacterized protein n=1 Tax=Anguilla anguilla TaxID=7936 RepID=A0A0E9RMW7_ANGAN